MEQSIEQTTEVLLCLSPGEAADLKEGINFLRNKKTGKDFILYKNKNRVRACKNVCKHQGGLFIKDIEDLDGRSVRCTKHNWRLDVSTMKYVNPPGSFCQDELVVEMDEENGLLLLELNPPNPWDSEPRSPEHLAFGEVQEPPQLDRNRKEIYSEKNPTKQQQKSMSKRSSKGESCQTIGESSEVTSDARLLSDKMASCIFLYFSLLRTFLCTLLALKESFLQRKHFDSLGEITYLTHACMDLKLGDKRMVFDPWLTGPAFARGWWLLHEPPSDWLERLCQADLIYISHMHSDHLSYPTLKELAARRPDIPIYVGNTERPVFWNLNQSGVQLTNINIVPFGIWQQVDKNLRFMILMDGVHPEMDTCIIVEYKGHKILNTVDCTRPNGGRLPEKVALMMSDFAGGASGFPMTFSGGKFTEEWKAQFIKAERKKLLNYKARLVKDLQPRIYCPFAGYFVESHPSDKYIKETNIKNDPNELNNLIKKNSDVVTWTPRPGATLDLSRMLKDPTDSKGIIEPPEGTKIYKDSWDFEPYLNILNAAVGDEIFLHSSWIKEYFTWAGFKDYNLVVRMIETDEDFSPFPGGYDYLVDFLDLSFPKERPSREHPYEEIRSRVDVVRHVVKNGLLWDDLYIGFQTRLQRSPDIYHHL